MDGLSDIELPEKKEERISLALGFIREQNQLKAKGHEVYLSRERTQDGETVFPINKHDKRRKLTIRQVALYFQIPKSTLYDRMRADQGQKRQRTAAKAAAVELRRESPLIQVSEKRDGSTRNVPNLKDSGKTFSHVSQMKFSPEEESSIVSKIQGLTIAFGNLPLISDLRECVSDITDDHSLGNKWITGFIRRHGNESVYGIPSDTVPNPKFENFKQWRNAFSQLYDVFVHQVKQKLATGKRFQYICHQLSPDRTRTIILSLDLQIHPSELEKDVEISFICDPIIRTTDSSSLRPEYSSRLIHTVLEKIDPFTSDLVILEGFTPLYHWDWSQCLKTVNSHNVCNKLYTVPWGTHLLAKFFPVSNLDSNAISDLTAQNFESAIPHIKQLISTPITMTFPSDQSTTNVNPRDVMRQLLDTISTNESRVYREVQDPQVRVTLCDIFSQVRILADSMPLT